MPSVFLIGWRFCCFSSVLIHIKFLSNFNTLKPRERPDFHTRSRCLFWTWVQRIHRHLSPAASQENQIQTLSINVSAALPNTDSFFLCFIQNFFFFFFCVHGMQNFPGQGPNPHHSSGLSHSSDDARSFPARPPGHSQSYSCYCSDENQRVRRPGWLSSKAGPFLTRRVFSAKLCLCAYNPLCKTRRAVHMFPRVQMRND